MRYIIIIISFILFSCEEWTDYYKENNQKPTILIRKYESEHEYQKSISDSLKLNFSYTLDIRLTDDLDPEKLTLSYLPFEFDGDFILEGNLLKIFPSKPGKENISVICQDIYSKSDTATIKLTIFNNVFPIAKLSFIYKNGILHINSSESYDPDQKYGGGIVEYEFFIGGNNISWNKPVIDITTSIVNSTAIGVRVKDNEGAWSNWVNDWVTP